MNAVVSGDEYVFAYVEFGVVKVNVNVSILVLIQFAVASC